MSPRSILATNVTNVPIVDVILLCLHCTLHGGRLHVLAALPCPASPHNILTSTLAEVLPSLGPILRRNGAPRPGSCHVRVTPPSLVRSVIHTPVAHGSSMCSTKGHFNQIGRRVTCRPEQSVKNGPIDR